jgi:excisionase family DNA binding protein
VSGQRLTYTVEEAGQLLGIGRGSAYQAARAGELPTVRLGRRLLVPRAALTSLLNASEPTANGLAGKTPEAPGHAEL